MIGRSGTVTSNLASVHASNSRALSDALSKLASGKKFESASGDLPGFIRSNRISSQISNYKNIREHLSRFKTFTSAAKTVAETVYENLSKLKSLAENYAATSSIEHKAEYNAEFNSVKIQVGKTLANSSVDSINVNQKDVVIASVALDPSGSGMLELQFSDMTDNTVIESMVIDGVTVIEDIKAEIRSCLTYLSEAIAYDNIADQQLKLNEMIILSKENFNSMIVGIDDASEMSRMLDLSVRLEATIAMIAQGNMLQSSLSMLYDQPLMKGTEAKM